MSKLAKILSLIAVSSIAFVQSLFAEEAPQTVWNDVVDKGTYCTITEVLPEGTEGTPWSFKLTKSTGLLELSESGVRGSGTKLNFRTIKLPTGYAIKKVKNSSNSNATNLSYTPFGSNSSIQELYWPDTITTVSDYTYYKATSLEICDYPIGTPIESIGKYAFRSCAKLKRLRISDKLKSLHETGPFLDCVNLVFEGPMLPAALMSLSNGSLNLAEGAAPLQDGLLVIGGSGGTFEWKLSGDGNLSNKYFRNFNITNLIFGAGVSHAGINPASGKALYNPYAASTKTGSSITNIVVRNPGVFAFGSIFNQDAPTTVRNYDVAGWVTGRLVKRTAALAVTVPEERQETAKLYQTRIMAAKNAYWKEFKKARDANKSKYYTPWSELSVDVHQAYWDNFNDGKVGSGDAVPLGLTKGITSYSLMLEGEEPLDPLTIPDNVWVVFKEGPWPDSGFKVIVR